LLVFLTLIKQVGGFYCDKAYFISVHLLVNTRVGTANQFSVSTMITNETVKLCGWHLDDLRFECPQGQEIFLFLRTVQTSSGTHAASFLLNGCRDSFPEVKGPGLKLTSSAEVQNQWSHTSDPSLYMPYTHRQI